MLNFSIAKIATSKSPPKNYRLADNLSDELFSTIKFVPDQTKTNETLISARSLELLANDRPDFAIEPQLNGDNLLFRFCHR